MLSKKLASKDVVCAGLVADRTSSILTSGKFTGPGVVGEEGLSQQSEFDGDTGSAAGAYGKTGGFQVLSQESFDEFDCRPAKALCCTSSDWAVGVFRLAVTRVPRGPEYLLNSMVVSLPMPWRLG